MKDIKVTLPQGLIEELFGDKEINSYDKNIDRNYFEEQEMTKSGDGSLSNNEEDCGSEKSVEPHVKEISFESDIEVRNNSEEMVLEVQI